MSVRLMTQVWDIPLPCSQKLVLLKLADNAHDDGLSARPGVSVIARQSGLSERCVQYALRDLESAGYIAATQFAEGGRGHVTEYRLTLVKGANDDAERVQTTTPEPRKGATGALKGANLAESDMAPKEVVFMNRHEPSRGRARGKQQATPPPQGWQPSADLLAWAKKTFPLIDTELQTQKFLNHADANDRRCVRWGSAWRNWIISAEERRKMEPHTNGSTNGNGHHPEPTTNRSRGWDRSRESYEQYQARTHADA